MNTKNKNTDGVQVYEAPIAEVLDLLTETFTMASSLEDYQDNPIFG